MPKIHAAAEQWGLAVTALQSQARLKMLSEPGHLYAAYSRYCDWIKLGFTSKAAAERIDAINHQYAHFAPFSLIGFVRSTWRAEQQLHRCLAPLRGGVAITAELYPATPALVQNIKALLTYRVWEKMPPERSIKLWRFARHAADQPLDGVEAKICMDRFRAERALEQTERTA